MIRAQTAEALGTIGESAAEAAPALVQALKDTNDRVRAKAAVTSIVRGVPWCRFGIARTAKNWDRACCGRGFQRACL